MKVCYNVYRMIYPFIEGVKIRAIVKQKGVLL